MILCPHCQNQTPPDSNFCQQCGKPISDRPADATVSLTSVGTLARGPRQQNLELSKLFADKARVVIGRAPDCDIYLPHPSISRYHARIERTADGLSLTDLSSVNGTWLGGRRISEAVRVQEGDRVGVGPYLLSITGGMLQQLDNSKSLRLEAHHLEKVVHLADGSTRKILDDINLVVNPGEFVSLLGPSGCGKSTLMDALNGRRPATGGKVLANGEDFYKHFDNFRQSLGYVPQKDIVHTGLTVYSALYYTARLRLPLDTDDVEARARIEAVLREMELIPHRDTLVANLSGGQIKRVSLGAELIAEPSMLYIDEATSGLDAGTEARMMRLFRRLADEGRSIVCITHNVDNVDQCHLILVLAKGKLMYYGPPTEALRYFKVKRISEVYDRLASRELNDWESEFRTTSLFREFVSDRLASKPAPAPTAPLPELVKETGEQPEGARVPLLAPLSDLLARSKLMEQFPPLADRFRDLEASVLRWRDRLSGLWETAHQFRILTIRYLELIWNDRRGLRLLLLQAPIVALFLLLGFIGKNYRQPMPILRPLTAEERKTLVVLRAFDQALDSKRTLTQEQKEALRKVRVKVAGLPADFDGSAVVALLRQLSHHDLSAEQKQSLREVEFTVDQDGSPITINALEMVGAWKRFQGSDIPSQLLNTPGSVVPEKQGINPSFTYMLLFIVVMVVLWFGCNNAAKEIVKEEAIYSRERAVNLHLLPYLGSKFVVLTAITMFHAAVLMAILFGTLEGLSAWEPALHNVPPSSLMLGYGGMAVVLVMLSMTGVALGLFLSACVSTPDRANALLPYVLIPQMILGGGIITVNKGALHYMAVLLSPVYWAFRGVHRGAGELGVDFPLATDYEDGILWPCVALGIQALVFLIATAWFLKRKDV